MPLTTTANSPPLYLDEPFAYPTRLRIKSHYGYNVYQLYAYPKPRPKETIVQLQTTIPALVTHILGRTWHDELNGDDFLSVLQPNWTESDEHDVALRIFRAGGALLSNAFANGQLWLFDDGFRHWYAAEQQKKYIFGWPDGGGVWVLHLPPLPPMRIAGRMSGMVYEDERCQPGDYGRFHYNNACDGSSFHGK
ncbi:hypothetical protein HBH70_208020 [Parastagonospora nodorum]|nr:hypothetical protein HBI10_111680 [Parastagonospora nodorum]KAH4014589.1 hypothetical protein HBI13_168010 [Parastagonospora nodorum]KAH4035012.1 hypothetical protein HBI09_094100 [Parastagonospora nodorum]KAH4211663.1 hypothetical protein HBI95_043430 [Parastagonospora nodorum]KAH4950833.1 hypothetical protein HBH74_016670 [Parastagonospora nodorum]